MSPVSHLNFRSFTKTIQVSNTAERLYSTSLCTSEFEMNLPSANAGTVRLGGSDMSSLQDSTHGYIPRASNTTWNFNNSADIAGEDKYWDFSRLYVFGTAGDKILIQYRVKE